MYRPLLLFTPLRSPIVQASATVVKHLRATHPYRSIVPHRHASAQSLYCPITRSQSDFDTASHRGLIQRHVSWEQPHSYLHPNGGLGQGLGLALGAKLARPQQPVVALMGDGGFLYNPVTQSFGVALEANLPFMTIVFNNSNYEAMRRNHRHYYPDGVAANADIWYGVHIPGPDYAKLVEPFGGYGARVEDPAELKPALGAALAALDAGKVALVDVVLSI